MTLKAKSHAIFFMMYIEIDFFQSILNNAIYIKTIKFLNYFFCVFNLL